MPPLLIVRQASAEYPVWVGRGLIEKVGSLVSPRGSVFVVTTQSLGRRFGESVASSFSPRAETILIPEGESSKTLGTAADIVTALLARNARRDSLLVALGGGMVGDTTGFAAAIFMRGIDLVQVPTTLLAQVDSSIGGKVGVNHATGKNLIGAFHPPRAVIVDPSVLDSLPRRDLNSGMFEALKGGVVGDPELFALFESGNASAPETIEEIVKRKIAVKAGIVSADERESGVRRLLNYGHTVGHAIEAAFEYEQITHGEAVGWGMLAANAIAERRGLLDAPARVRIDGAIRSLGLPALSGLDRTAALAAAGHDKKNMSRTRVMILPRSIGDCVIVEDVTESEIEYGLDAVITTA